MDISYFSRAITELCTALTALFLHPFLIFFPLHELFKAGDRLRTRCLAAKMSKVGLIDLLRHWTVCAIYFQGNWDS